MKIQINGFDIEINTEEANLSLKVLDANGKELSNNTYAQSLDTATNVTPVQMPAAEDTTQTPDVPAETPAQGLPAAVQTAPVQGAPAEVTSTEELAEGLLPTFEQFKKLRKDKKI